VTVLEEVSDVKAGKPLCFTDMDKIGLAEGQGRPSEQDREQKRMDVVDAVSRR